MNIIKIILYPSPLAPFFCNEEDLKLRCKLEWPNDHRTRKLKIAVTAIGGGHGKPIIGAHAIHLVMLQCSKLRE